ncbi:hypothetical protein [Pseudomarimonas arenosa]|uniref:Uncharacterized protein n=1 Tax=Pseudomarimonas arenosa TaxID=2774145 RepID=A0AAW3ZJ01_9GAMM|nr:hypothetical protein [Pseudomarimonas arenosa]MBD8525204.1 hypothetical protein [Pseudomarimonas arenosa]
MLNTRTRGATLLLLGLCCGLVRADVGPEFDGTWFNPEQSGHGFSIEVVNDQRAVALWYSYDLDGNPLTLYLDGEIEGSRIEGPLYAPRGMRFGEFDPADIELPVWGSMAIDFSDCNSATVSYQPSADGFPAGSLPIQRLVKFAGPACELSTAPGLPSGVYQGDQVFTALLDQSGQWYGIGSGGYWAGDHSTGATLPGSFVLRGEVVSQSAGRAVLQQRRLPNDWLCILGPNFGSEQCVVPSWPEDTPRYDFMVKSSKAVGIHWPDPVSDDSLSTVEGPSSYSPSDPFGALAGQAGWLGLEYRFPLTGDNLEAPKGRLQVQANGALCVRFESSSDCLYRGQLQLPAVGSGQHYFQFELQRVENPLEQPLRGIGWIDVQAIVTTRPVTLHLIGDNGTHGIGLRASNP